jgi:hypothetical protein
MDTKFLDGERALAQMAVAVLSGRFGRYVVGTTVEVDGGVLDSSQGLTGPAGRAEVRQEGKTRRASP